MYMNSESADEVGLLPNPTLLKETLGRKSGWERERLVVMSRSWQLSASYPSIYNHWLSKYFNASFSVQCLPVSVFKSVYTFTLHFWSGLHVAAAVMSVHKQPVNNLFFLFFFWPGAYVGVSSCWSDLFLVPKLVDVRFNSCHCMTKSLLAYTGLAVALLFVYLGGCFWSCLFHLSCCFNSSTDLSSRVCHVFTVHCTLCRTRLKQMTEAYIVKHGERAKGSYCLCCHNIILYTTVRYNLCVG